MIIELIDKCILNDERAKTKLYKLQYSIVYKAASKYFKDTDTINELIQLSFIKIFNNLHKCNVDFDGWCYIVSCNECISYKRKLKAKKNNLISHIELKYYYDIMLDVDTFEVDKLNTEKMYSDVLKYMDTLSPIYKKTFESHYLDNDTYIEISKKLGNSVSSCKTNCMKARNIIKKKMSYNNYYE